MLPSADTSPQASSAPAAVPGWRLLWQDLSSPAYRRAAAWSIPVALLAYGFAMANFTLAGDDWFAVFPDVDLDRDYLLWAGRWATPLIWTITGNGAFVPWFTLAAALGILIASGLVAASALRLTRAWAVFALVALGVSCPLYADKLSFKLIHFSSPLAVAASAAAGWLLLRGSGRVRRMVSAAALVALTLAIYQPTALVWVLVLVGGEVREAVGEGGGYWRKAWPRWLEAAGTLILALAAYFVSVRVAWWATSIDPSEAPRAYSLVGGYPSDLGEIGRAVRRAGSVYGRFWFQTTALYPVALKAAGLALVAAGAAATACFAGRARDSGGRWARRAAQSWIVLLGVASTALPFTTVLVREDPPLRAAVFVSVGWLCGMWAALLLEHLWAGERRPQRVAAGTTAAVVVLLALAGAFQVGKGFTGLHLAFQRDLASANRMLSVMEQMPEFAEGEEIRVELVGRVRFATDGPPFSNVVAGTPAASIVNCSGLGCQNHLVDLLNLVGGGDRPFVARRVSGREEVAAIVAEMPPWPQPGSIRYLAGSFVIKGY